MKREAATLVAVLLIALLLIVSFLSMATIPEAPKPQWSITYPRVPTYIISGSVATAKDEGYSVVQTTDGGYAIAATWDDHGHAPHSGGVNNYTGVIIKTDSSGQVQWKKPWATSISRIKPHSIIQTSDSGFLLGNSYDLFKLDAEGTVQWSKNFEPLYCYSVIQTEDGGYFFVGNMGGNYINNRATVLLKTDYKGDQMWNETVWSESSFPFLTAVTEASDGGYVAAGTWGDDRVWLVKTSVNGTIQLTRTYDIGIEKRISIPPTHVAICKTKDSGYILAGGIRYGDHYSPWLAKIDSEGDLQWNQKYGDDCRFVSVVQVANGGYLAVGDYLPQFDNEAALLVKADGFGKFERNATYGEKGTYHDNIASFVIATADGGFAVVGTIDDSVWLAKFAPEEPEPQF